MKARMVSVGLAVLCFAALSGVAVLIFQGMRERTLLESHNDGERTVNTLFSSLRNHEDFGDAIETMPSLSEKVIGVALFAEDGTRLYTWGSAPAAPPDVPFVGATETDRMASMYRENARNASTIILIHPSREGPPPPKAGARERASHPFMFETLRRTNLIHLEIRQPSYWRDTRLQTVLFPIVEALLAALVVFVRFLVMRNAEYRTRIEQQKNLVLLGTAASTLAHEIKNPLLAIRLQTGILSRTLQGQGDREIAIIDDEVNRLSSLSHRVNDILRDPAGNPCRIDPRDIAAEVGTRLCGRPIVTGTGGSVRIDPERMRSILENLLRNALESGGEEDKVAIEVTGTAAQTVVDVLDRGTGVPQKDRARVFDPFFTTKSRGSGIGLAICLRFVGAAGGTIELQDRAGGGCRARVILPAAEPEPAERPGA
jgi:two-component system, NtrC family, sensor histidine kinase HydH